MTNQELIRRLEYWADLLENPTYNSLEVGFRHSPLTKDETLQRYKTECGHDIVRTIILIEREDKL